MSAWPSFGSAVPKSSICLLVAAVVEVLLRTISLPRACKLLGIDFKREATCDTGTAQGDSTQALDPVALRVAALVDQVYRRYPLPDTCLRRALVAGKLLGDQRPELVLGVRTSPRFEAHAWLKVGGGILDWSDRHGDFKPL